MPPAPSPHEEQDRLTSYQACEILDTAPTPPFDRTVRLAAALLDAPVALVTMAHEDRHTVEAAVGLADAALAQAGSFGAHAAMSPNFPLVVEDATADRRFAADPLVTGPAGIRSCVAIALVNEEGHGLGALCVLDRRPRTLTDTQAELLSELAAGLSEAIYLRKSVVALCGSALHDNVTGLANRTLFEYRLDGALGRAGRADGLALLCVHIDRLQDVNTMFGHAAGDELLREAARRITEAGGAELVARTGADEFAVLVSRSASAAEVEAAADRLVATLARPVSISGQEIGLHAAVGFAIHPDDGDSPALLFQRAKATLEEAKRDGKGGHRRFEPAIERESTERHELERDLRAAIENDGFYLYWQPIADAATRQPVGHEALLRWDRPGHGPVPPGEFINAAEACGLSGPLDAWVLRQACREAALWSDPTLRAAVNVSANRVRFGDLSDAVAAALEASGLPPTRLEIEITERVLMEDEGSVRDALGALRALGVRITLDDFGTGFSSIGFLRSLPLDKLKLDRSFTRDLATDPRAREVARTVVRLGSVLGLIVLAEGVETEDQLSCLKVLGCDEVQGYLLGWPRPIVPDPKANARPRSAIRAMLAG